jgi:signal peptidase I
MREAERLSILIVKSSVRTKKWIAGMRRVWNKDLRSLLIFAIVVFAVRSSLADWNDVPTGSMKPTILEGDRVFVNKLAYDLKVPFTTWHVAEWATPTRGDIVVFFSPQDEMRLVKRVIGLPGDVIELRDDKLIINGNRVDYESLAPDVSAQLTAEERSQSQFASEHLPTRTHAVMAIPSLPAKRNFGPVEVPEGHYFMMGDNRDNSADSRYFGMVERRRIVGKATDVVLSFDNSHCWIPRSRRFFKPLDPSSPY